MAHVAEWKKDVVKDLENIIRNSSTIAVVKVDRIPGVQLQDIRANLRGPVQFKVAKQNLIRIAIDNTKDEKKGVEGLENLIDGQAAILGTSLNPFKLFALLKQNMQPMPAKGGEEAPEDIVVEPGETSFPPGPIVGEFGKVGIPAAIDKGKVVIKKRVTPVKEGQKISRNLALMLTKLEIFPFQAGVALAGAWEEGVIYHSNELDIDMDAYRADMINGARMALNLAVFTAYMTPKSAVPILRRARTEALNLATFAGILTKDTTDIILSKAYGGMLALARLLSEGSLDDELQGLLAGTEASRTEAASDAVPASGEEVKEKEEKEPEEAAVSEEDAVAGLGALFG